MSENTNESFEAGLNAWKNVEEAVARANSLGAREFQAYLNWTRDLQKEFLEYSWYSLRQVAKAGEVQLALLQRIKETFPILGTTPKGTETVAGMVTEVVNETRKE